MQYIAVQCCAVHCSVVSAVQCSAIQCSGPILSKIQNVRRCVCVFVRHTPLTVFLPPFPKVCCPNILDFRNPWGKGMKRCGLRFKKLLLIKGVKLPRNFFLSFFWQIFPNQQIFFFFWCWANILRLTRRV